MTISAESLASRLRREIRQFENEKQIRERILIDMNAIECSTPGCAEIANWPSKLCTQHRLERRRHLGRERSRRFRAKKRNASNAPPTPMLETR
jgi:hypothetical protein